MTVYAVTERHDSGDCDYVTTGASRLDAMAKARQVADTPGRGLVFVEWFRESDHCCGYLNHDGDHSPTGEAW